MNLTLFVWRQAGPAASGRMERYQAEGINPDSSFLEMLDVVNECAISRTATCSASNRGGPRPSRWSRT